MEKKKKLTERESNKVFHIFGKPHQKMLLSPDEHSWASATIISENAVLMFYSRNCFDFVEADVKLDSLSD